MQDTSRSVRHSCTRTLGVGILVLALAALVFMPSVFGYSGGFVQWIPEGDIPDPYGFTTDTVSEWISTTAYDKGWTVHYLEASTSYADFTGWQGAYNVVALRAIQGASWWFWNDKDVFFLFSFVNAANQTNRLDVVVHLWCHEQNWGTLLEYWIEATVRKDTSIWQNFDWQFGNMSLISYGGVGGAYEVIYNTRDVLDIGLGGFKTSIRKINATYTELGVYNLHADSLEYATLFCENTTINSDFWDNTMLSVDVMHSGYGEFEIGCTGSNVYTGANYPPVIDGEEDLRYYGGLSGLAQLLGSVGDVILPSWVMDLLGNFAGYAGSAYAVLGSIWGAVLFILPFTPFIIIIYVMDVVYSSVVSGSIQPIGILAMGLFDTASALVSTVVAIAGTIYDFIHFW